MASVRITLQQLQAFHTIDRKAYARLVCDLGFECDVAKEIVAFWRWLERERARNFILNMLLLPDQLLLGLALEAVTCLKCLKQRFFYAYDGYNNHLPLMTSLVDPKISLYSIYMSKQDAEVQMKKYVKDFYDTAFSDMIPVTLSNGARSFAPGCPFLEPQFIGGPRQYNDPLEMDVDQEAQVAQETFFHNDLIAMKQTENYFVGKYGEDFVECITKDLLYMLA